MGSALLQVKVHPSGEPTLWIMDFTGSRITNETSKAYFLAGVETDSKILVNKIGKHLNLTWPVGQHDGQPVHFTQVLQTIIDEPDYKAVLQQATKEECIVGKRV